MLSVEQRRTESGRYLIGNGRIHGMHGTAEYRAWDNMIARCTRPSHKAYKTYGARRVTVCSLWRRSFKAFFAHIGPRPSVHHSVDRIKNRLGYQPGNVKWSTRVEQARNTNRNRFFTIGGVTRTAVEWAEVKGINYSTLMNRIWKGKTPEEAVGSPVNLKMRNGLAR
jgi:hypothetical protein